MADDWIKMRCDLDTDPDVIGIAAELKIDVDTLIGKLFRLWKWAGAHSTTGHIRHVTFEWIDSHLALKSISKSLETVGWLRVTGDGITIPKFSRHNSQSAKQRALTARRVAKHRAGKCNARVVTKMLPEERRVEEKRNTTPTPPGAAAALREFGVSEATIARCVDRGISAWDVFVMAESVARDEGVRNVAAVLTHRLLNGYTPTTLIKPLELSTVANSSGRVASICGHRVVGAIKHNPEFVYFTDDAGVQQKIPAKELKPSKITFTEEP